MDEQLRPCPWCGEQPEKTVWEDDLSTNIECINDNCPGIGLYVFADGDDHERRAIAAWNTRPVEDALRAENERLRAALREIRDIPDVVLRVVPTDYDRDYADGANSRMEDIREIVDKALAGEEER